MASSTSTGTSVPNNTFAPTIPFEPPILMDGLVRHALLTASVQVRILSIIDEANGATLGDIMATLDDHPDPAGAVNVMVELGILVLDIRLVVDANTIVRRRADPDPDTSAPGADSPLPHPPGESAKHPQDAKVCAFPGRADAAANPGALELLDVSPFRAQVVIGSGADRRAFDKAEALRRPGVYVMINDGQAYVGTGCDVGHRVAAGQQRIAGVMTIAVITDANDALTDDDARAAERMLWSRVSAGDHRALVNDLPAGAAIEPERYSLMDAFLAQACLALHHAGLLFHHTPARKILAGPVSEHGRVAPLRAFNQIPEGNILELGFGSGLVAMAAHQDDDRWVLLRGSDVRVETAVSAASTTRFLRSAWAHGGQLEGSPDGMSYVTTRDLLFRSCSGLTQFCTGAKGYTRDSWTAIDPTGGYDSDIEALIAG